LTQLSRVPRRPFLIDSNFPFFFLSSAALWLLPNPLSTWQVAGSKPARAIPSYRRPPEHLERTWPVGVATGGWQDGTRTTMPKAVRAFRGTCSTRVSAVLRGQDTAVCHFYTFQYFFLLLSFTKVALCTCASFNGRSIKVFLHLTPSGPYLSNATWGRGRAMKHACAFLKNKNREPQLSTD
jgi:hypothetical protein